jgi:hypothetical protein
MMSATQTCPKCGRQANFGFSDDLTKKSLVCQFCDFVGPAIGLPFDPEPKFLFKYRRHDEFSKSWILNDELYLPSPLSFNDPFDAQIMYTFEGDEKQKRRFLGDFIDIKNPGLRKRQRARMITERVKSISSKENNEYFLQIHKSLIANSAVLSLTTKFDDILMFSHYADNHTGYCLKFRRTAESLLSIAEPVIYSETYPKISIINVSSYKTGDFGRQLLYTKSKRWAYEDEWRVTFARATNRVVKSPFQILDSIILACAMKPDQRKEIIDLNKQRSHPVQIFEAVRNEFEFTLEIKPVEF